MATIAPVIPITRQPAPSGQNWARLLAALAYRNHVTPAGIRRMMVGFPSEAEALAAAELQALANGAA